MLELLFLQLDLLAGRRDGDQGLPDPGDLVEHLLVGEVEHLVGLLGGVQRLVGLGREYVVGPLEERHGRLLLIGGRNLRSQIYEVYGRTSRARASAPLSPGPVSPPSPATRG